MGSVRLANDALLMRKTGVFARQERRSARITRSIGGRAERQPRVAGDSRLNPARVGQPDQPDDLAGVGRKLLTGLSFHGGDSFRLIVKDTRVNYYNVAVNNQVINIKNP